MVVGLRTVAVVVAAMPCLVAVEMMRDVRLSQREHASFREALDAAAFRSARAATWTLATMLCFAGWFAGLLMLAYGFVSIFDRHARHNPVLAFMLPGSVLVSVCLAAGCVAIVRALRAATALHAAVSARR